MKNRFFYSIFRKVISQRPTFIGDGFPDATFRKQATFGQSFRLSRIVLHFVKERMPYQRNAATFELSAIMGLKSRFFRKIRGLRRALFPVPISRDPVILASAGIWSDRRPVDRCA